MYGTPTVCVRHYTTILDTQDTVRVNLPRVTVLLELKICRKTDINQVIQ